MKQPSFSTTRNVLLYRESLELDMNVGWSGCRGEGASLQSGRRQLRTLTFVSSLVQGHLITISTLSARHRARLCYHGVSIKPSFEEYQQLI